MADKTVYSTVIIRKSEQKLRNGRTYEKKFENIEHGFVSPVVVTAENNLQISQFGRENQQNFWKKISLHVSGKSFS